MLAVGSSFWLHTSQPNIIIVADQQRADLMKQDALGHSEQ